MKPTALASGYRRNAIFGLDGRCKLAKILKQRRQALERLMGEPDELTYGKRSLLDRFLGVEVWVQQQEAAMARGEVIDDTAYLTGLNTYLGLFRRIELAQTNGHDQHFDLAAELARLHRERTS